MQNVYKMSNPNTEMKKEEMKDNSFGVASVILGILSVTLPLLSPIIIPSFIFAVIALVFSKKQEKIHSNIWSKRGKTLSIIGIVLSVLAILLSYILISNYPSLLNSLQP